MASLAYPRLANFQTLCTFLYPPSCFAVTSTAGQTFRLAFRSGSASSLDTLRSSNGSSSVSSSRRSILSHQALSRRNFTTTSVQANARGPTLPNLPSMKGVRSAKAMAQEEMRKQGIPDDIGLFENTFIMPSVKPGFFSSPRLRVLLEWVRFKTRASDFGRVLVYKFAVFSAPRPRLYLRKTAPIARGLYQEMYSAFAAGEGSVLNRVCCEGLAREFQRRIAARPLNTKYRWTLHRFIGKPRVVSHKAAQMPLAGMELGQRQAVVRITSVQSLDRVDAVTGKMIGAPKEEETTEYLVIQQRHTSVDGSLPWKVWGTISENGWESLLNDAGYEQLVAKTTRKGSAKARLN